MHHASTLWLWRFANRCCIAREHLKAMRRAMSETQGHPFPRVARLCARSAIHQTGLCDDHGFWTVCETGIPDILAVRPPRGLVVIASVSPLGPDIRNSSLDLDFRQFFRTLKMRKGASIAPVTSQGDRVWTYIRTCAWVIRVGCILPSRSNITVGFENHRPIRGATTVAGVPARSVSAATPASI